MLARVRFAPPYGIEEPTATREESTEKSPR